MVSRFILTKNQENIGWRWGDNSQKLTFRIQLQQLFLPSKIVQFDLSNAIYAGDFNLKADSA